MPPELAKYVAAVIPTIVVPVAYKLGIPEGLCGGILAIWGGVLGAHILKEHGERKGKGK